MKIGRGSGGFFALTTLQSRFSSIRETDWAQPPRIMSVQLWGLLIVTVYGSSLATGNGSSCSEAQGSFADDALDNALFPGAPLAESQATTKPKATGKSELEPTEHLKSGWFDATLNSDYRGFAYIAAAFGTSYVALARISNSQFW